MGGYSTNLVVPEDFVLKIPAALKPEAVAPILCAGITTFSPLTHWGSLTPRAPHDHAWLRHRAPNILPIPGTGSLSHLEENLAAAKLDLAEKDSETLSNFHC